LGIMDTLPVPKVTAHKNPGFFEKAQPDTGRQVFGFCVFRGFYLNEQC